MYNNDRKIIYNKITGSIIAIVPIHQDVDIYFHHYSLEFKNNIDFIISKDIVGNLQEYKVDKKQIVKRTQDELNEIKEYGKILTDEERRLNQLSPTYEEVRKAENTIEILTLLQEVM